MSFSRNQKYTRKEIHDQVGGGSLQSYLPNKDGKILCICLDPSHNPQAPYFILPGQGPDIKKEAQFLCQQKEPVPVFIKEAANKWKYVGIFEVEWESTSTPEIHKHADSSGRSDISQVIKMKPYLDLGAQKILELLVHHIEEKTFVADKPKTFLGYKQAHDQLGLSMQGPRWGLSLDNQGLGDLAYWCLDNNLPALTGLVVSISEPDPKPSGGYFECYNKAHDDFPWWQEEVAKSLAFDWTKYIEEAPIVSDLISFEDEVDEGKSSTSTAKSRKRCAALRKRAKEHYRDDDGKLRCRACSWSAPDSITQDIVEMHHLNPISESPDEGRRLTWKEALDGVRPLCPTCHRVAHAKSNGVFSINELEHLLT